ncbi:MAG TPA: hypothetical protein VKW06_13035 [Candidatus Angelobacter sp.]|nr:hypothetical protein [Candidatus Angelobacter sp.]
MKKHLVAFLSMIGLAGVTGPVRAQVLKGSDEESKVKTESKIKSSKQLAEKKGANAQIQDKRKDKWAKADAENKAVKADVQHKAVKNDASIKRSKDAAEIKSNKNQANIKMNQKTAPTEPATQPK